MDYFLLISKISSQLFNNKWRAFMKIIYRIIGFLIALIGIFFLNITIDDLTWQLKIIGVIIMAVGFYIIHKSSKVKY